MKKVLMCLGLTMSLLLTACSGMIQTTYTEKRVYENDEIFALAKMVHKSDGLIGIENKAYVDGVAYVYDNSLAAITLVNGGAVEEAQKIMDSLLFAVYNDRSRTFGRIRNAYPIGDCKKNSGKSLLKNETYVPLPVLVNSKGWYEKSDDASSFCRNIAWAILAFCEVGKNSSEEKREKYIDAACTLAEFMLRFRTDDGQFKHGYYITDTGTEISEYISSATNILIYSAYNVLANNLINAEPDLSAKYRNVADDTVDFINSMYFKNGGYLYRGILADNSDYRASGIDFETQAYYLLSFEEDTIKRGNIEKFIEDILGTDEGFSFVVEDSNAVFNEGTAIMALIYGLDGYDDKKSGLLSYLQTQKGEHDLLNIANRDGVSTQIYLVNGEQYTYDNIESVSATCWLALAKLGINPLKVD